MLQGAFVWGLAMSPSAIRLGRYQLQDQIAAGGTGEVWRAVDTVLDRPVAVKLLRAEHARPDGRRQQALPPTALAGPFRVWASMSISLGGDLLLDLEQRREIRQL